MMATAVRPHFDTGHFFEQLARAEQGTLVLDFETTLAMLPPTDADSCLAPPSSKFRYPNVAELLECILACGRTRVIVATTRPALELGSLLAWSEAEIWASDGLERLLATTPGQRNRIPLCMKAKPGTGLRHTLMHELATRSPLAYLVGETRPQLSPALAVIPELHLDPTQKALGQPESFVQFLADWLRACAGEIC